MMYDFIDSKSQSLFLEETFDTKRQQLVELIKNWNENRLELFAISMPQDDSLEIYGAMRFYFKDTGEKVFSKCLRISSTATTETVIEALVEKFRPDMKMLTTPEYSLWEAHENGNERKLGMNEKPLLVQLNWHKDDKDGRFILKNDTEFKKISRNVGRFSKRFKNEFKKRSKSTDNISGSTSKLLDEPKTITEEIFYDVSSNPFNRTISNPEVVLKKRRQQKLENKLKEIMGSNGGTLKIYGHNIDPYKNYVSILVSIYDRTSKILTEALQKYGLENEDPSNFILTQKTVSQKFINEISKSISELQKLETENDQTSNERILHEDECPLINLLNHKEKNKDNGGSNNEIIFTLKRRSSTNQQPVDVKLTSSEAFSPSFKLVCKRPIIVPINQLTGKENHNFAILIQPNVTIVGSNLELAQLKNQGILLTGQNVSPRHCLISFFDGDVSITPLNEASVVEVNGQKIISTTLLRDGFTIKIGVDNKFRFYSNSISNKIMPMKEHFDTNHYATPIFTRKEPLYQVTSNNYTSQNSIIYPPQNLPGLVEVSDEYGNDDLFLSLLINNSTFQLTNFCPGPAFILYMSLRYRSCTMHKPSFPMDVRNRHLQLYFDMMCKKITNVLYSTPSNVDILAFWLTVTSELLFIVQSDIHLNLILSQLEDNLFNLVEKCFSLLNDACHIQLSHTMDSFLNEGIDDVIGSNGTISVLNNIISQLQKNNTNADLQIQIFSQLFHYINMYIFNWMVGTKEGALHLTHSWAIHLKERLYNIYRWAENHGLELAFECHMDRIQQAVNLLITPKTIDQVAVLGATCYKLNSLQVEYLLTKYICDSSEIPVTESIVNDCIKLSQLQADESTREEGLTVELLEEKRLNVPFIFPQKGFVIELQKGIPSYLMDLIDYLEKQDVCNFIPLTDVNGSWTVHMRNYFHNLDTFSQASTEFVSSINHINDRGNSKSQVISVSFTKINNGIGLSIVAAQNIEDKNLGIYVKQVFEEGAAYKNGKLEPGDRLLSLNGYSLIGISQEAAADIMINCGPQVHFEVEKYAAFYNGLSSWFSNKTNSYSSTLHKNILKSESRRCKTNRPLVIQPGRPSNCYNSNILSSFKDYSMDHNSYSSMYNFSSKNYELESLDSKLPLSQKSSISVASIQPNNFKNDSPKNDSKVSSRSTCEIIIPPPLFLPELASKHEEKRQSQSCSINNTNYSHTQSDFENTIDRSKKNSSNNQEVGVLLCQKENKKPLENDIVENNIDELTIFEKDSGEEDEPRVQIIGNNEIYNDPRIKRLNKFQSCSNNLNIDGSNLNFKDKIKMFAISLNEEALKTEISSESVRQEIKK